MNRIIIGLTLALFYIFCFYMDYQFIVILSANIFNFYDCFYMTYHNINKVVILLIWIFMVCFNYYISIIYHYDPKFFIIILTICEIADVFQYYCGKYFGKNKIGWISKNKTFEGYIGGYFLTILTFTLILPKYHLFYKTPEPLTQQLLALCNWNYLYCYHFNPDFNIILVASSFCYLSLIYFLSITGGLISSLVKRCIGIKDYSNLLGEHGGWIDRIDCIILPFFVIPFLL